MILIIDKGILLIFIYVNNNIKSFFYILVFESFYVCGCYGILFYFIRVVR